MNKEAIIDIENPKDNDLISRQSVNKIVNDIRDCISVEGYCAILERLKKLPPVTQKSETVTEFADRCRECGARYGKLLEQKTGHWIEKDGFDGDVYYDCSVCGESWTTIEGTPWDNGMSFCPNCGAKMESEE